MQWVEGRLGALYAIAEYLATYPPDHAARQVGWLATTLDLEPSTVTYELASAFRASSRPSRSRRLEFARHGIDINQARTMGASL